MTRLEFSGHVTCPVCGDKVVPVPDPRFLSADVEVGSPMYVRVELIAIHHCPALERDV